jgi:phosphotransferase system HPr (HPr) family protein
MKRAHVVVPWEAGLHLRPAAKLVRLAQRFRATVLLRCGERIANLGSILSVMALCAVAGTTLEVQASGEDELEAIRAVEAAFTLEGAWGEPPDTIR